MKGNEIYGIINTFLVEKSQCLIEIRLILGIQQVEGYEDERRDKFAEWKVRYFRAF